MNYVSLKDGAARVDVTFPTRNKILKGEGIVSSETRYAVLQAARRLEYVSAAVVGYASKSLLTYVFSSLTTMHNPFFERGKAAIWLLNHRIVHQTIVPPEKILPSTLVVREPGLHLLLADSKVYK